MKSLTSIFYLMLISCMTFVAAAQNNIDKAIAASNAREAAQKARDAWQSELPYLQM